MKKYVNSIIVMVCICAAVSILLALTNVITEPIIIANENSKASASLLEVLPDGGTFETMDLSAYTLPATVDEVYLASNGGHVVKMTTTGYSSGMVLMCGINPDGTVASSKIISSNETPSIGGAAADTFAPSVVGMDIATIDGADVIAGATKTTAAYRAAVKDALNTVIILGGGSVDLRSDEEILNDNLSAVLPDAQGAFAKYFFVEVIDGVDAIYSAENGTGYVCVIGETFIAADASGNVLTACTDEEAQIVTNAIALMQTTTTIDLDLSAYADLPSQLISAKVTASGNYIIEIKGAGYGIAGGNEYHPASGEYIIIRLSLTADGTIIDCLTVSEEETDGIGSACADEAFYGQFDGKTEATYNDIDAISGATLTTDGYKKAILRAFASVKIFEENK